jgi:hypothetical protein
VRRVLSRIFQTEKEEVIGGGQYYTLKTLIFYSWPNVIRLVKSRNMKWVDHMVLIKKKPKKCWSKYLKGRKDV